MAIAMREGVGRLIEEWRGRGIDLGFGIGIASGDATLGHIGSDEQFHYTAIGSVVNLASRLCDKARDGQILVDETVSAAVQSFACTVPIPGLLLKGFSGPLTVYRLDEVRLSGGPGG